MLNLHPFTVTRLACEGKHDPWPYANYLLDILKTAYKEFEDRAGQTTAPRGEKSEIVARAVQRATGDFSIAALQRVRCLGRARLTR